MKNKVIDSRYYGSNEQGRPHSNNGPSPSQSHSSTFCCISFNNTLTLQVF